MNVGRHVVVTEAMRVYGTNGDHLMTMAGRRQQDLMDPSLRDELSAARAVLKTNWTLLMTASKAYLRHPELAAAKANRDFVLKQVCKVNTNTDFLSDSIPFRRNCPVFEETFVVYLCWLETTLTSQKASHFVMRIQFVIHYQGLQVILWQVTKTQFA